MLVKLVDSKEGRKNISSATSCGGYNQLAKPTTIAHRAHQAGSGMKGLVDRENYLSKVPTRSFDYHST
jgi:hypothetical protein